MPGEATDKELPELLRVTPDIAGRVADPRANITLTFTELLDQQSFDEALNFYSLNGRDINETVISNDNVSVLQVQDLRTVDSDFKTIVTNVVIQNEDEESTDDDRQVTSVDFSPSPRFALNSRYRIVLDRNLKDLSKRQSVNPVTDEATNGNFIEREISVDFEIQDGTWKPAEQFDVSNSEPNLQRTAPRFLSNDNFSGIYRIQSATAGARKQLMVDEFDDSAARLDPSGQNFASLDELPNDDAGLQSSLDDVIAYEVTASEAAVCIVWSQEVQDNALADKINFYARCGNLESGTFSWKPKVLIKTVDIADSYSDPQLALVGSSLLTGYLHNNQLELVAYEISNGALTRVADADLNWTAASAIEFDLQSSPIGDVSLMYSQSTTAPYFLQTSSFDVSSSGFRLESSQTIDSGSASYTHLQQGFDFRGLGFGMWISGTGASAKAQVSRFDGAWDAVSQLPPDGRGGVLDVALHTFWEGHAMFTWIQDIGTERQVRATGYFPVDGGSAFIRPNYQILIQSPGTLNGLGFAGDFEGNGMLYATINDLSVVANRFSDNAAWDFAWDNSQTIYSGTGVIESNIHQIQRDGRFVSTILRSGASQPEIHTVVFAE